MLRSKTLPASGAANNRLRVSSCFLFVFFVFVFFNIRIKMFIKTYRQHPLNFTSIRNPHTADAGFYPNGFIQQSYIDEIFYFEYRKRIGPRDRKENKQIEDRSYCSSADGNELIPMHIIQNILSTMWNPLWHIATIESWFSHTKSGGEEKTPWIFILFEWIPKKGLLKWIKKIESLHDE